MPPRFYRAFTVNHMGVPSDLFVIVLTVLQQMQHRSRATGSGVGTESCYICRLLLGENSMLILLWPIKSGALLPLLSRFRTLTNSWHLPRSAARANKMPRRHLNSQCTDSLQAIPQRFNFKIVREPAWQQYPTERPRSTWSLLVLK